jgi:hypothetical protein
MQSQSKTPRGGEPDRGAGQVVAGPRAAPRLRVVEFEPRRRQVHVVDDGPFGMYLEIDIEPMQGGCRVTQGFGVEPRGALRVVVPVLWPLFMRRLAQDAMERTVANAKAAAEASKG